MNKKLVIKYLLFDYLSSTLSWFLFFLFRKLYIEAHYNFDLSILKSDSQFWYGILLIPIFWVCLYAINGFYHQVLYRSRLTEFVQTFWVCLLGCLIIFFLLLLDDNLNQNYKAYYKSLIALLSFQFTLNYLPKFTITSSVTRKVHKRIIGFNALIIGEGKNAFKIFNELEKAKISAGYFFKGYLSISDEVQNEMDRTKLQNLGGIDQIQQVISEHEIKEVIIATDSHEIDAINQLISELQEFEVRIKIIPNMRNILTGQVKMNSILHAALIEVDFDRIPYWQKFSKRAFDIGVSIFLLIVLSPLFLVLAIIVKSGSEGPVFFKQERIGKKGKPFFIIKFRSMYINSEQSGPQLSKDEDSRITPFGKFLRKTRMDEIPQFYNVLKGEMAIVGPRPERMYFIKQIVKKAPQYKFLYKIKPGITSWGQVKYGYAENVKEMIERLKFDLIYLENRSFIVDIKIMIYTILVVIQGKGK